MHFSDITYLDQHLSTVATHLGEQQLFVVGGAVRDIVLGVNKEPHDIDMTLAGEPDAIYQLLQKASHEEFSLFRTEKYGTMTLIDKATETQYELTPLREEGSYSDNRHPDEIRWSDSLLADAKRRDFTINCLYYTCAHLGGKVVKPTKEGLTFDELIEVLSGDGWEYLESSSMFILQKHELIEKFFHQGLFQQDAFMRWVEEQSFSVAGTVRFILDPFLGLQDIHKKILRAVGEPEKRFQEDALRILRGVRHVNLLNQKIIEGNFDFHKETWQAMKNMRQLVPGLAKERLHQEIVKVFAGKNPFGWVALIDKLGLLETLFPALYKNKHDEQPVRYHPFDTYSHILLTLWHVQKINDDYLVKLGMLYHDVGKKDQYAEYAKATTKEEQQAVHSSEANHVVSGPVYVEEDFRQLGFSNKEIEEIQFYVAQHMRPGQILTARPDNQIKRMRQLLSEYGYERVKNLLDITVADRGGQFNPLQGNEVVTVQWLYEILEKLYSEEGQFTMRQLAINGDDIMQTFSVAPGPQVKGMLEKAFDRVLSDIANRNTKETIVDYLRSQN